MINSAHGTRTLGPSPEQQIIVLVDAASLRKAERRIESCEGCNEDDAEIPFDNILDRMTGSDPSATNYILEHPAKCSRCLQQDQQKDAGGTSVRA